MKKQFFLLRLSWAWLGLFVLLFTTSCDGNDEELSLGKYATGYWIVNEGNFGRNNASVSHISKTGEVEQHIFLTANMDSLGNNLQSVTIDADEAYLLVSASNKIEVVNRGTFVRKQTITGNFANPRYMATVSNTRAYVSTWGNFSIIEPKILVLDTQNEQIVTTIEAGAGAEDVIYVASANKVFVSNTFENTISVYNTSSNTLEQKLSFYANTPNEMVLDKNGKLWVIAPQIDFTTYTSPTGKLYRINPATNAIEDSIMLNGQGENVQSHLSINPARDKLYYHFSSSIFELPITATSQATNSIITMGAYAINVDKTGNIWVSIADFFNPNENFVQQYNSNGALIETYPCGVGANQVIALP